jgi:hypothetical protein
MAVPPVRLIAERKVAEHFLRHGATCAADAIPYEPERNTRARAFDRLKGRDVLRPSGRDRWYLDEARWADLRSSRRRRAAGLIAVGAALAAFVVTR